MIVVGVDRSEQAKRALRWAVGEARLRGTTVRAVHAFRLPMPNGRNYIPRELLDRGFLERKALEIVDAVADEIARENPNVTIDRVAREGTPATVLCEAAEHADLLVVGSHRKRMTSLLLGSVDNQCALRAPCAVVIVDRG